jgi:serine/threonine-protein kinase/endoribonuclease IRE1
MISFFHFRHYVLELCEASLDRLFLKDDDPQKYSGPMPSEIEVLQQLAEGLEYIHKEKVIHRDIKPENVLIWMNPVTREVVMKWSGFGLSKEVNERGTYSMSTIIGTLRWFAPEILKLLHVDEANKAAVEQRGTVKTDVFAEGLVFGCFLLEGLHLFGSSMQIPKNIIKNNPANLSSKPSSYFHDELINEFKTILIDANRNQGEKFTWTY